MSEQKSFMQLLDEWTDAAVIQPLVHPTQFPEEWEKTTEAVKKRIREKVLESYHNGQAAGPRRQPRSFRPRG